MNLPFDCVHLLKVTTLVSSKSPQMKKGKSKRAIVLVAAVEKATQNFVERGEVSCHWSIYCPFTLLCSDWLTLCR